MNTKLPNYRQVIQDLLDAGWTQERIARDIDTSQANISRLYRGQRKDPHMSLGLPLLELHKREMRNLKRRQRREAAA